MSRDHRRTGSCCWSSALDDVRLHAARAAASRSAHRRGRRRPTSAGCTPGPPRCSAAWPCCVGLPRRHGRRRAARRRSTPIFTDSTEPLGLVIAAVAHARRRHDRRHPRGVAAGEGGRHRAVRQRAGRSSASRIVVLPRAVRRASSSCRPDLSYLLSVVWVLGHGQRHQPHRRPRRPGRRHRRHRRRARSSSTRCSCSTSASCPTATSPR